MYHSIFLYKNKFLYFYNDFLHLFRTNVLYFYRDFLGHDFEPCTMKPIRIYKTSKSVYLYNPNKSLILQIDRQTFNGTEHTVSTNFETDLPNKTDQIALWIKVRDREKLSNVYLEANVSAIFGVFQQRHGSCYLLVEHVEEQQIWEKFLNKKMQSEIRAPNVKIKSAEIFCLKNPLSLISVSIEKITNAHIEDRTFKDLFSQFPAVSGEADDNEFFYCWSDSYNISKSLQNQSETSIDKQYLWNSSLLTNNRVFQNLKSALNWCVQLAHGFIAVSQTESSKLVIIAKRSSKFAGTRFLKRGCDLSGNCANDVEVEQILINKRTNQCSSFVQHRASVPGLWTQDIFSISGGEQSMTPQISRPKISIFCNDPSFRAAGRHFSELQRRYNGGKIYILNLLRSYCSSSDHPETEVSELMNQTGEYFKQFNHGGHEIDVINLDMANESKCTVLDKIEEIAHDLVLKVGFYCDADFQPGIEFLNHEEDKNTESNNFADKLYDYLVKNNSTQKGVIRSNCLDCLDRTNTAQLIIGQVALSCQMYALGLLQSVEKITSTTIGVMFPQIFEQMGNAIAQQYGGSTLVHNLESYNKNLNKKNRDLLTTINRYYSLFFIT